tara:strand:+ start:67 stop:969 length:903 start_codon:yes stop_codon:yes gene_type:complete
MAVDKKIKYKNKKPAMQGGGPNYLGKQKEVKAPLRWKSSPNHPEAHLAYITDAEQDLLIKQNMHGGLEDGKPNKGPYGIPSLQGDLGGYDASPGGPDDEKGNPGASTDAKSRAANIMTGKVNVTSPTGITEGYTGDRGVQRGGIGDFVGQKYTGKGLFGLGSGYRDVYTQGPRQGQVKPGYLGRVLGGIGSLITGIPFVGSALGTAYDYGKGLFGLKDYYEGMDEEEKDRIANLQMIDGKLVDTRNFEDTFGMRDQIISAPSISNLNAFDRFNMDYNPNQNIYDVAAVRAMIENAKGPGR